MKLFAIFGDPVAHSRSPLMHNHVFGRLGYNACYTRVRLENGSELRDTFFRLGLAGANVTVPHKEAAFEACDDVRGFAREVGVVNTLINEDGRLIGYNTDADGFMFAIRNFENVRRVLLVGAGGTARALSARFKAEGFEVTLLNRSAGRLEAFREAGFVCRTWDDMPQECFDLIVNTTSAGLEDDHLPAPETLLRPLLEQCRFAADAIYGKTTPFLALAQQLDKPCIDGSDMLLGQGVLANRLFVRDAFDAQRIETVMAETFAF